MAINNERGQALLEGVSVFAVLSALILALLVAFYALFGRAWIQFQAEQALLCLSEKHGEGPCRAELEAKLDHYVRFGEWHVRLSANGSNWNVDVQWVIGSFQLHVAKSLDLDLAAKAKVSPLSL